MSKDKYEKGISKRNIIEEKEIFFNQEKNVNKAIKINRKSTNKKKIIKKHNKSAMEINDYSPSKTKNNFYQKFAELLCSKYNV